eukprot:gene4045-5018_t
MAVMDVSFDGTATLGKSARGQNHESAWLRMSVRLGGHEDIVTLFYGSNCPAAGNNHSESHFRVLRALWAQRQARGALLPGIEMKPLAVGTVDKMMSAADKVMSVDVGSSLSVSDWNEIDHKEVVAKTKAGASYRTMLEIQPWEPSSGASLDEEKAFAWFYVQRRDIDLYKKLAKQCFEKRYKEVSDDKALAKEVGLHSKDSIEEDLLKLKGEGKHTLQWLKAVEKSTPQDMLFLRRAALDGGPSSIEWKVSKACWAALGDHPKRTAFEDMYQCTNKVVQSSQGGKPMRHKHQEELLEMVDDHLQKMSSGSKLPLHMILSTPTGSGKTFSAILLHLKVLRELHPDTVLVYSVLKRVGQECEAHNLVYWTAAKDGQLHQVRRPYSIRTRKPPKGAETGQSGTMKEQLDATSLNGRDLRDRGHGKPGIIIADIHSTAAILEVTKSELPTSTFSARNVVLYFDEPNMGIHQDPDILEVVQRIVGQLPMTAILASATLPSWSRLEGWWKSCPMAATRTVISQPPFDLPMSTLSLFDANATHLRPLNPLALFKSHAEFCALTAHNERLRILLLRHFTARQGNDLLGVTEEKPEWLALQSNVRTLRETLEPQLRHLTQAQFNQLRTKWASSASGGAPTAAPRIQDCLSKTGVTMVATLDARRVALELAGYGDQEKWAEEVHKVKGKCRAGARFDKKASKEKERTRKDDEDAGPGDGDAPSGGVELRKGVHVTAEEVNQCDDDTLVMLTKGIAFACSAGAEAIVKRLYQQALLHIPEKATVSKLPPIHTLVVDYSSVYGTDCNAVDTIILMEDLGEKLTWEDHQQFLGRLRRDGKAIYLSLQTLRKAVIGTSSPMELEPYGAGASAVGREGTPSTTGDGPFARVQTELLEALSQKLEPTKMAQELNAARKELGLAAGDMASHVFVALLALALPAPAKCSDKHTSLFASNASDKERMKVVQIKLQKYGAVVSAFAKSTADQAKVMKGFADMCGERGAYAGKGGARLLPIVMHTLKVAYDEDVLTEEGIFAWAQAAKKQEEDDKFLKTATPFITWLQEAEDDDEEEEDED